MNMEHPSDYKGIIFLTPLDEALAHVVTGNTIFHDSAEDMFEYLDEGEQT